MNYLRLNVNALPVGNMTLWESKAGVCEGAGTGFMCTRGELTATPNLRPTPYIPAGGELTREDSLVPTLLNPNFGELTECPNPVPSIYIYSPRGRRPRERTGHAKRGLRPQGAPAPQRGHSPASGVRYAISKQLPHRAQTPRAASGTPSPNPNPRKRHSPASVVRYAISKP